ncbi:hypothetical protein [Microbacterium sp. MPKO10]|uniref:hypothetical protein n=1 Tax=Microbacterium sp. MPKO10 TaxID=2989818 RepID=UPI0022360846|nr:hypothetical protein [Microbacterium sp. MPKO10]MCW4457604.1 hypothetical protein [Microbacterium sp. MPKO10]
MVTQPPADHTHSSRIQRIESFHLTMLATSSAILILVGLFLPLASFRSVNRRPFSIVDLWHVGVLTRTPSLVAQSAVTALTR